MNVISQKLEKGMGAKYNFKLSKGDKRKRSHGASDHSSNSIQAPFRKNNSKLTLIHTSGKSKVNFS